MTQHLLDIRDIKVRYGGLPVLHGVSLHLDAGETVCVIGANGAGKSTLLRSVIGSQRVFEGQILFQNQEIQKLRNQKM